MRPIAERHGLSMLQLACAWNLAQPAVGCVAPTLIQEPGRGARPVEDKRAELAAVAGLADQLTRRRCGRSGDRREQRQHGAEGRRASNTSGKARPDRWQLDEELAGRGAALAHRSAGRSREERAGGRKRRLRGTDEHRRERHQGGPEDDVDRRRLRRGGAADRGVGEYVAERAGAGPGVELLDVATGTRQRLGPGGPGGGEGHGARPDAEAARGRSARGRLRRASRSSSSRATPRSCPSPMTRSTASPRASA